MSPIKTADSLPYIATDPVAQPLIQCPPRNLTVQAGYWGFLLFLTLAGGFCLRHWSLRRWKKQSIDHRQRHIQDLERIWKMRAYRKR